MDPFIHVLPPAIGFEMSTITDFMGVVAAAEIQGTARGSDGSSTRSTPQKTVSAGVGRERNEVFF